MYHRCSKDGNDFRFLCALKQNHSILFQCPPVARSPTQGRPIEAALGDLVNALARLRVHRKGIRHKGQCDALGRLPDFDPEIPVRGPGPVARTEARFRAGGWRRAADGGPRTHEVRGIARDYNSDRFRDRNDSF